jgi:hypothetical protein
MAANSPVQTPVFRKGDALDTVCAAAAGLDQNREAPPGAPPLADLELAKYVGS